MVGANTTVDGVLGANPTVDGPDLAALVFLAPTSPFPGPDRIDQGSALANHMSTAYDGAYLAGVPQAWTYLLTAGLPAPPR